jgi:hypothetical protein
VNSRHPVTETIESLLTAAFGTPGANVRTESLAPRAMLRDPIADLHVAAAGRADELATTYRRRVVSAIPEVGDDRRFRTGLAATCLAHAFERLSRFLVVDARERGDCSRVQLVATLESAAEVAERRNGFPHLAAGLAGSRALRRRWPDADVDLSAFVSYAPR